MRLRIYYVTYPSKHPWGSDFAAMNLRRYSRHEVIPVEVGDVRRCSGGVVHLHNVQLARRIDLEGLRRRNRAVIGGVRGWIGLERMRDRLGEFDAIAVNVDPRLQIEVRRLHERVYETPEGVDTELFKPRRRRVDDFIVLWVGSDHKRFKNAHLLPKLGFPYRKATYRNYIPHEEMPEFYAGGSVLVNLSEHEGFCRPILEAAACGLPVVSSDVGVARRILDDEWIVEGSPRRNLGRFRELLIRLRDNPELRVEVGRENRLRALEFDWRRITPIYDDMWEEVAGG